MIFKRVIQHSLPPVTRDRISATLQERAPGVMADGIHYASVSACAKALNIHVQTVYIRIRSEAARFGSWKYASSNESQS